MPERVCHFCGGRDVPADPVPRDAECAHCRGDLRSCRNCRHWNPRYHNECTETQADPVSDRSHRNFCEYFYYSEAPFAGAGAKQAQGGAAGPPGAAGAAPPDRAAEARAKLENLFKKPDPPET